jgi:hypothetical protein
VGIADAAIVGKAAVKVGHKQVEADQLAHVCVALLPGGAAVAVAPGSLVGSVAPLVPDVATQDRIAHQQRVWLQFHVHACHARCHWNAHAVWWSAGKTCTDFSVRFTFCLLCLGMGDDGVAEPLDSAIVLSSAVLIKRFDNLSNVRFAYGTLLHLAAARQAAAMPTRHQRGVLLGQHADLALFFFGLCPFGLRVARVPV